MFERFSDTVKITLIISGALVIAMLIGTIGWLVYTERDTAAIMALVGAVITPVLMALLYSKTATVEKQTNGQMLRMMKLVEQVLPVTPSATDDINKENENAVRSTQR